LYERADLLDLIDKQQVQTDNRMEQAELDIAKHALTFGDKIVRDVMTPRRAVKMIPADEDLGPVLMSELHDSGHSRFPVYEDKQDNIVGVLFLRDLINSKSRGKTKNLAKGKVMYLHEEQSLYEGLQAVLKTRQHLYIVVNDFEEYVGIVTIEDILEEIVGKQILDEFDRYEDIRAVAARAAAKEHKEHVAEQKISTESTEVVE
jgi:CBS domain containing-hemolysin-like protein